MSEPLPAPLLPPEVDLREFEWMPLMVRRYRDSRLIATRSGDEIVAATLLWSASWHQVPAASLPDDDAELAQLAGYGRAVKEFRRHRDGAMHGLVKCSDGRWWHHVVAEKAAASWNGKLLDAWRKACDLQRKVNKERLEKKLEALPMPARPPLLIRRNVDPLTPWQYGNSAGIPPDVGRNSGDIGRGRRRSKGDGDGHGKAPPPSASEPSAPPATPPAQKRERLARSSDAWEAYADEYHERYGAAPVRNAKVNGMMAGFVDRLGVSEAPAVARWFVRSNRGLYVSAKHAVDLLLRDAEGLRTEWATQTHGTETEARQADRTQARGNAFQPLIDEARTNGD